ncbi:ATP-NAD kinase-like domain-containing protein [Geopyxis carbonaria]|nr:ATP-NAD kinase-like domain-containing protein [Geopyxis carbonaria]
MAAPRPASPDAAPASVTYDATAGVTLSTGDGDDTTIPLPNLICLLTSSGPDAETYTLLHYTLTELHQVPITAPPAALLSRYLFTELPSHLSPDSADTTIIVSTASGRGSAGTFYTAVLEPLLRLLAQSLSPSVVHTTSASSIADTIAPLAAKEKQQTILLLSGDTGINDALNALPDTPGPTLALALFPLGTGNALAHSLHTSRGTSALAALLFGAPHLLPTFTARFSPGAVWTATRTPVAATTGAVVVSWGFHASLVADAEALRDTHGVERFSISARDNLSPPHAYTGTLSILPPGEDAAWRPIPRAEHFYTLATMCSNLEEAFRISPASRVGERVVRVVHFAPMESEDVGTVMGGAYQGGTHVDDERVGYEVARGVRIEVSEKEERWRRICVDGGTVVLEQDGWVELLVDEEEEGRGMAVVWRD